MQVEKIVKPLPHDYGDGTVYYVVVADGREVSDRYPFHAEAVAALNTDAVVREGLIGIDADHAIEMLDAGSRDEVSELAMSLSLCPIHFVDWAICFDDEDPTCEQVRLIFPIGHDT